jgi:hypothetical protein
MSALQGSPTRLGITAGKFNTATVIIGQTFNIHHRHPQLAGYHHHHHHHHHHPKLAGSSTNELFLLAFRAWPSSLTICEVVASSSGEFVAVCYHNLRVLNVRSWPLSLTICEFVACTDLTVRSGAPFPLLTAYRQRRINTFYSFSTYRYGFELFTLLTCQCRLSICSVSGHRLRRINTIYPFSKYPYSGFLNTFSLNLTSFLLL